MQERPGCRRVRSSCDRHLPANIGAHVENGLTWRELVAWWTNEHDPTAESELDVARQLYDRLQSSMDGNEAEQFLFAEFSRRYGRPRGE